MSQIISARFTANEKKNTNIPLLTDDGEVRNHIKREHSMDRFQICTPSQHYYLPFQGIIKDCNVHKPKSHQAFAKAQTFPTNRMGKVPGNKQRCMKCKFDTRADVSIMPLTAYKHVNP